MESLYAEEEVSLDNLKLSNFTVFSVLSSAFLEEEQLLKRNRNKKIKIEKNINFIFIAFLKYFYLIYNYLKA